MDLATVIGLIGAFAIVIYAMVLGGDVSLFLNLPSALIVLVGSTFTVLIKFGLSQFIGAMKVIVKAFKFKLDSPQELIGEVVELADLARKGGLLSLEGREVGNSFLAGGIQLLVDGHDPDVVRTLLTKDQKQSEDRHSWGAKIFEALADVAPAMGMIGTLIGLVVAAATLGAVYLTVTKLGEPVERKRGARMPERDSPAPTKAVAAAPAPALAAPAVALE